MEPPCVAPLRTEPGAARLGGCEARGALDNRTRSGKGLTSHPPTLPPPPLARKRHLAGATLTRTVAPSLTIFHATPAFASSAARSMAHASAFCAMASECQVRF